MNNKSFSQYLFNCLDFDPSTYIYTRPILDSKPYQIKREEKRATIIFNALGVDEKDAKVEVIREGGKDYLSISGETKNEVLNRSFSVSGRFSITSSEIESITWEAQNGFLIVEVAFKEPEKPTLKIEHRSK